MKDWMVITSRILSFIFTRETWKRMEIVEANDEGIGWRERTFILKLV